MSHWLDHGIDELSHLRVTPELDRLARRTIDRLRQRDPQGDLGAVLRHPASTPFVPLIDACARDLGLSGDPRTALLGRSTLWLYLYVRVQDDLVDEPRRVDRSMVYAAELFLSRHLSLYAQAVPGFEAMAARSALMERFSGIAAREAVLRRSGRVPDGLHWMGEKFLPMAVPLVALAHAAGRPELGGALERFVVELGTGLQLVNDVHNVREDHAGHRPTPLQQALDPESAALPSGTLAARVLGHPVLLDLLGRAREQVEGARRLAQEAGMPATAAIADHARAMVDAAPRRLLGVMLGVAA